MPCNQQSVGIFPRSEGENAVTRRAKYGRTERGGECQYAGEGGGGGGLE